MSYVDHEAAWGLCQGCRLHEERTRICLYRGDELPLDVLFIGEAPGPEEDLEGKPFVGPSGRLLESMIKEAQFTLAYGFTNVVCCFPEHNGKIRRPTKEEVSSCWPRLADFLYISKPKAVVFVGKVASQETRPIVSGYVPEVDLYELIHPAYLLRRGRRGVLYTEALRTLERVNENYQDSRG